MVSKQFLKDAAERIGWQVGYALATSAAIYLSNVSYSWAPALMVGLNLVKVVLAKHVGNPNNAAIPGGSKNEGVAA
jgi:hypothetical protein